MPPRPLSRSEVRDIDRRAIEGYGLPVIALMENAGRGTAELMRRLGISGKVVICAGKGNNGGDGFVVARHLDQWGVEVRVLLAARPSELSGEAAINYQVLCRAGLGGISLIGARGAETIAREFATAEWIVDALLGTGARGEVREPMAGLIRSINAAGKRVLAVDLPSGLDCDTGLPSAACVRADHTATFVAPKTGFDAPGADSFTGTVHVVDIGVPRSLLRELEDK